MLLGAEKKRNNLVSELLEVASISNSENRFAFTRSREGWIFVSAAYRGKGKPTVFLENAAGGEPAPVEPVAADAAPEATA